MNITLGELISHDLGAIQFSIPDKLVLVWRDHSVQEAVLCDSRTQVPALWHGQNHIPWKIFGSFETIKRMFHDFMIPPGSKVVDLSSDSVIQMDLSRGRIRYMGKRKKRALIVDDSSTIRKLLKKIITSFDDWEIVGELESASAIPEAIRTKYPDLVTLDLHLGNINGVEAMKKFLAPRKIPTLLITSQSKEDGSLVMDALDAGAFDYLQKPESGGWEQMKEDLNQKMDAALRSKWHTVHLTRKFSPSTIAKFNPDNFLIAIGSSTGGTQALQQIFTSLPAVIPPILVTQHIPAGFSKALAERLNGLCPFEIKEAVNGDDVRAGRVLIAPGDHHMKLSKDGKKVEVFAGDPVNRFRPSVEVLFRSVTANSMKMNVGVMLTGMGKDGAEAMVELHKKGAFTIAQDESTSVVFGMPKEAIKLGAVDVVVPVFEIPETIMNHLSKIDSMKKGS